MTHTARLALLSIAALLLTAAGARASVIDFQSLESNEGQTLFAPYVEDGFQVSAGGGSRLASSGTQNPTFYAGSTGMYLFPIDSYALTLTAVGGGPFTLTSIDFSLWGDAPAPIHPDPITFIGTTATGGTVTQTFTPLGFGFTTFTFDATFTDVVSVVWQQSHTDTHAHQFDNIVVEPSTASVPEPTTLVLFGTGLIGVTARLRSRRV
jgi:hypothetical protein